MLLGRLRRDIETWIWNFGTKRDQDDSKTLENAVKQVIKEQLDDENALHREGGDPLRQVFVLATLQETPNNSGSVYLSSYQNPQAILEMADIPIWMTSRATLPAHCYFPPMRIRDFGLIDGGMSAGRSLSKFSLIRSVTTPNSSEEELGSITTNTEINNTLFQAIIN